jgi:GTPase SAR1 family protein
MIYFMYVGLDNAGKTSIIRRLADEDLVSVRPTQGFQIKSLQHNNTKLMVWDVGGQKSIRPYWRNYFEAVDALVNLLFPTSFLNIFTNLSTQLLSLSLCLSPSFAIVVVDICN